MKLYQLHSKQYLPTTAKAAWDFLSNPFNLGKITPPYMGFKILDGADKSIFPGQIIQYMVTPFPGYKTKWVTEITHAEAGKYFVDEQRFGPYSLWHHKHFINSISGGVEMEDIIDLKLPYGIIGKFGFPLIKKQLLKIFEYREQKLIEIFGKIEGRSNSLKFKSF
ncbi:SRPBCC family protein [Maribacter sp. HTCC2170]|uniref:SRPBCC family protein n=1 Tax=Maribacter sp. (strain HTCC2170 / KCCM 42371) TaxID=313603 RepID=UPI00006BB84E|nr:SRPBCC family protein [Maribacter sp. HTCC2170]EAQ99723.1 hypothetical protein FB2170_10434 [Maribacter sp. HTCC2170]